MNNKPNKNSSVDTLWINDLSFFQKSTLKLVWAEEKVANIKKRVQQESEDLILDDMANVVDNIYALADKNWKSPIVILNNLVAQEKDIKKAKYLESLKGFFLRATAEWKEEWEKLAQKEIELFISQNNKRIEAEQMKGINVLESFERLMPLLANFRWDEPVCFYTVKKIENVNWEWKDKFEFWETYEHHYKVPEAEKWKEISSDKPTAQAIINNVTVPWKAIGPELYWVPLKISIIPIHEIFLDKNSKPIWALWIAIPRENQTALTKISWDLAEWTKQISLAIEDLAFTAQRQFEEVNTAIFQLSDILDSTKDIENITTFINSIAAQTKMLWLNAAIEAARAWEAWRWFAVVADEVRKLSEQSNNAADEIKTTIFNMVTKLKQNVERFKEILKEQENTVATTEEITAQWEEMSAISAQTKEIADRI